MNAWMGQSQKLAIAAGLKFTAHHGSHRETLAGCEAAHGLTF